MFAKPPLLALLQGHEGPFANWLETLGLKEFTRENIPSKLVDWGWLEPVSRIIFPVEFFFDWRDFPSTGYEVPAEFETQSLLWDSTWYVNTDDEPLWFLHPWFRPGDTQAKLLQAPISKPCSTTVPNSFNHPNGTLIFPYADYFFHWQGYALVDVIRTADCIRPIINTPNVIERAKGIMRIAERIKDHNPALVLHLENRWAGLAVPMTWLSHYKSFCDALHSFEMNGDYSLRRKGAIALASHLGFTADDLLDNLRNRLLVLARDWIRANERSCRWTAAPYQLLRLDILLAVEWLCYLTGNYREHYLKLLQYDRWGNNSWAQLKKVLPFEGFVNREKFLELMPYYLKHLNEAQAEAEKYDGIRLEQIIDQLRTENYPFSSFIGSFRDMHDELSYHQNSHELDFRELRPLDGYLVLSIRAEAVFRYAIENGGDPSQLAKKRPGLNTYILYFAEKRLSAVAIETFKSSLFKTKLHHIGRANPVSPIREMKTELGTREDYFVKAFLCCILARNYFAHHYYFDNQLWRSPDSAFLLSGVIASVVCLLDGHKYSKPDNESDKL